MYIRSDWRGWNVELLSLSKEQFNMHAFFHVHDLIKVIGCL